MIPLAATFLGMGIYGVCIGKTGTAIMSFAMTLFMGHAGKKFTQTEQELAESRFEA